MKRLVCVLLLLLALVWVFAACDKNDEGDIPLEDAHVHEYGSWSVTHAADCTEKGTEKRTCACGESETREIAAWGHTWGAWSTVTAASCATNGVQKRVCICGASETSPIPATKAHSFENGECSVCRTPQLFVRDENTVYFGSYPQSEVTQSTLISALNEKAGTLPTSTNARLWTSYGYYLDGEIQNYMWYIDLTHQGERYRGVYFVENRPRYTMESTLSNQSQQDDNGYVVGTVYWFLYEPIAWTVLKEENGTALLFCNNALDAQEYYSNYSSRTAGGENVLPNNYAHSTVRAWLNDNFYEAAFTSLEQQIILTATVKNDAQSTGEQTNLYICENTQDKVFLLSVEEITNMAYGFLEQIAESDPLRQKAPTAYALAQGASASMGGDYAGNSYWWLRSPGEGDDMSAKNVSVAGTLLAYDSLVDTATRSIVPALQIQLSY